ncbi:MAG: SRPBCC family protein [Candidatus Obscuribacterales bacterium]
MNKSPFKKSLSCLSLALLASLSMAGGEMALAKGSMGNPSSPVPVSESVINGETYQVVKMVVKARPDRVWEVISDHDNLHRIFPQMKKATVVKEEGNNVKLVKYTVAPSGPVGTFTYTVRLKEKAPRFMEWTRVSGAFKNVKGFWKLEPLDNGNTTLATYATSVDGGFLIPQPLVKRQCRIDMPQVVDTLKAEVENKIRIAER